MACGGEHVVYRYGADEVIKFSLFDLLVWKGESRRKAEHDLVLSEAVFGPYVLPTRLATSPDGKRLAKIQRYANGRPLRRSDMRDASLRRQFEDLMRRRRALVDEHGADIDLLGGLGFLTGSFSNVFVEDGALCIIDALLVAKENPSVVPALARAARFLLRSRQDALARAFLSAF